MATVSSRDFEYPSGWAEPVLHGASQRLSAPAGPLRIVTPPAQWAYAVSMKVPPESATSTSTQKIRVEVAVARGRIGVGCSNAAEDAFLLEKFSSDPRAIITLRLPPGAPVGSVILRNADPAGASEFTLCSVRIEPDVAATRYPVDLPFREFSSEAVPPDGDTGTVFDTDGAAAINAARLQWLEQANLPLRRARVLDVGCGVGHFVPFYLARECTVVAVDGRESNIRELRRRHPQVDAYVADAQEIDEAYGAFDVIHCFGLLYHLESPVAALRRLGAMCGRFMIIETMVCDSSKPLMVLADETRAASQALAGLGCRPSPSFVALALNRIGMRYVYGASIPPDHPDFQFSWCDNLDTVRGPYNLRSIFVGSREPIDTAALTPLLD